MTRQDFNQNLLQTSFLDGGNAAFIPHLFLTHPFIEQLNAAYEKDRNSVPADWRAFFDAMGDAPESVEKTATRPELAQRELAGQPQERSHQRARRRLGRDGKSGRRKDQGEVRRAKPSPSATTTSSARRATACGR